MINQYGFDEKINFPEVVYDKMIYMDQYRCCWEFDGDRDCWVNLDATDGEGKHGTAEAK